MAYVTGTATDLADLRTKILAACTANGWTLTGTVLHRGTSFATLTVTGNFLYLLGGTGESGGALTGAAPSAARIGTLTAGMQALAWPLSYEVHVFADPDEVFVVINYSTSYYQWLAWGKSGVTLPGTGLWFSGSIDVRTTSSGGLDVAAPSAISGSFGFRNGVSATGFCPALFHATTRSATLSGEYINHGLAGGTGWSGSDTESAQYRWPLDFALPSAWNSDTVLLPIQAFSTAYGSSKVAMVLDIANARAVRIDNLQPSDIITLGPDRWKIYPWYLKAATSSSTTSGPHGWAIRYDGP
jgi:hypothetical protein